MQLFCALRGVRHPFAFRDLDSASTSAEVVTAPGEQLKVRWQDASLDSYDEHTVVDSVYDGTGRVDTRATVYLVMAVKGVGFYWLKEEDQVIFDGLLGDLLGSVPASAVLYRVDGLHYYPVPQ